MRKSIQLLLLVLLLLATAALQPQSPSDQGPAVSVADRLKQASTLLEKRNWKGAEEILNPLLAELQATHDEKNGAAVTFLLARAKQIGANYQEAVRLDELALKYYEGVQDSGSLIQVHNHLGSIYSNNLSKSQLAESNFSRALQLAEETRNTSGILVAVNGLAGVYDDRGDLEKSLKFYQRALELSLSTGNKRVQANVLQYSALVYSKMGDYTSAFQNFDKAEELLKELNNPASLINLYINRSAIYINVGEYPKAGDAATAAYKLAQQYELKSPEMFALYNLGRSMHHRGRYKAAMDNYLAALAISQAIKKQDTESDILNAIGETYVRLGDYKEAAVYHQRALDRIHGFNSPDRAGLFLRNVAGDYFQSQKTADAIVSLNEALKAAENRKDPRLKGFVTNDLGAIYFQQGDLAKSREFLSQALAVRREIGDKRGIAETLMHLGIVEYQGKQLGAAQKDFEESVAMAKAIGHPETLWRAEFGKGKVLRDQGSKTEAIATLTDAVETIEQIRHSVAPSTAADTLFFANKQEVYELLIELLIEAGQTEKAYEYVERSKSKQLQDKIRLTSIPFKSAQVRGLMSETEVIFDAELKLREQLVAELAKTENLQSPGKIAHLSDLLASNKSQFFKVVNELRQFHPDYERFVTVKPPSLSKVQRLIPADTLMLEYFPSETKLYIFEITSTDFKLRSVAVARAQLDTLVKSYRGEMKGTVERLRARLLTRTRRVRSPMPPDITEASMPTVKASITELYKYLIGPIEDDMASKKILTIIPSGLLYYLPFPALAREENGQMKYLVESKAISYLSSSDLFDLVFVKGHNDMRDNLVAFGNPDGTLPSALDEVERLKQIYPNSRVYMLWEAKKERLFDLPQGTELLHLATHGRLDSADVNESYIKLANEGAKGTGKLRLSEIYDLPLEKTSLVTLSACETALGEKDPGTEIASMAQAFSIAGAPTVVASLWAVYDPSTADIMESFYRELRAGLPKAVALQHAQIALLHNPKYSNPYFWAPFIMVGDWR
jgi:CHAT domain-containing protein/tetratricopeptide (TPR) repeat protein